MTNYFSSVFGMALYTAQKPYNLFDETALVQFLYFYQNNTAHRCTYEHMYMSTRIKTIDNKEKFRKCEIQLYTF